MCCESNDDDECIFCGSSEIAHHWADGSGVCEECQQDVEDAQREAHLNGQ